MQDAELHNYHCHDLGSLRALVDREAIWLVIEDIAAILGIEPADFIRDSVTNHPLQTPGKPFPIKPFTWRGESVNLMPREMQGYVLPVTPRGMLLREWLYSLFPGPMNPDWDGGEEGDTCPELERLLLGDDDLACRFLP